MWAVAAVQTSSEIGRILRSDDETHMSHARLVAVESPGDYDPCLRGSASSHPWSEEPGLVKVPDAERTSRLASWEMRNEFQEVHLPMGKHPKDRFDDNRLHLTAKLENDLQGQEVGVLGKQVLVWERLP